MIRGTGALHVREKVVDGLAGQERVVIVYHEVVVDVIICRGEYRPQHLDRPAGIQAHFPNLGLAAECYHQEHLVGHLSNMKIGFRSFMKEQRELTLVEHLGELLRGSERTCR
ncbi:MAG: hypothetical protein MUQ56_01990 [Thermoleophilia bacterium]|nr:hypothetical protein [Thermoleophilia bacterium]